MTVSHKSTATTYAILRVNKIFTSVFVGWIMNWVNSFYRKTWTFWRMFSLSLSRSLYIHIYIYISAFTAHLSQSSINTSISLFYLHHLLHVRTTEGTARSSAILSLSNAPRSSGSESRPYQANCSYRIIIVGLEVEASIIIYDVLHTNGAPVVSERQVVSVEQFERRDVSLFFRFFLEL